MKKEIICTVCPRGCRITVTGEGGNVSSAEGSGCPRGERYARAEFSHPVRILTTTVRLTGAAEPLLPVRSSKPVPKDKLFECMEAARAVTAAAPVKMHGVLIENVAGTGADLIAVKSVKAE